MERQDAIRQSFERKVKAMTLRPGIAKGTAVTKVRWLEGLACEAEEGRWKLRVDLPHKLAGDDSGPNPGVLGRATLGSCLTVAYAMWAAKLGVPLNALEVEIQADYDSRGMYGVGDVDPGYEQIRYVVTVESDASEEDIMRWLDTADAHCDFLWVFRDPQDVRREVRIVSPRS